MKEIDWNIIEQAALNLGAKPAAIAKWKQHKAIPYKWHMKLANSTPYSVFDIYEWRPRND